MPTPTSFEEALKRLTPGRVYTVNIVPKSGDPNESNLIGCIIRNDYGIAFMEAAAGTTLLEETKKPAAKNKPKVSTRKVR